MLTAIKLAWLGHVARSAARAYDEYQRQPASRGWDFRVANALQLRSITANRAYAAAIGALALKMEA